jgi:uncharacterized protein YcbK (DUF882 family)
MSKYIDRYILEVEYRCNHCGALPVDFYKDREISIEYISLFESFGRIREEYGKPIPITSGYRCTEHQIYLYEQGISSTPYSTHIFGLALDLCPPKEDIEKIVKIASKIEPKLRIGWRKYLNSAIPHVHIDNAYLIIPRYSKNLNPGVKW